MSTYVCSDIHGQYDLYKTMLNEINFTTEDHLYILGDMIDRGEDGIRVLQDVASRPNVTCLLGNHEYMMWNYISAEHRLSQNIENSRLPTNPLSKNTSPNYSSKLN